MKIKKFLFATIILLFVYCENDSTDFKFVTDKNSLITSYQSRMFYHHKSSLNNEMKFFLELLLSEQFNLESSYDPVMKTIEVVSQEKPQNGCYFESKSIENGQKKLDIVIEWNSNQGVVVHLFTNSNNLINILP
jgi:hypothetical protein